MTVSVEVPDNFAKQYRFDQPSRSRELLEAFLLLRYAEGELSAGQVGEVLGLSFHEVERFLRDHGAPPGVNAREHLSDLANLDRFPAR